MLISTIGNIREGKTTLTSIFALDSDKEIYSNYKLKLKKYHHIEPDDLFTLPDNIDIFIDEAYTWLESRKSGKDINVYFSHILFQSGKRDINIYLNSQLLSALDVRFRDMSNVVIECFKDIKNEYFQYDIYVNKKGYLIFNRTKLLPFSEAKIYWKYFDTKEIVKSDLSERFELEAILKKPKKKYRLIQDISSDIYKHLKGNYTHPNIKITMLEKEYSELYIKKLHNDIYDYINQNKKKNNDALNKNESKK